VAGAGYSPYIQIAGSSVVYNAPIVATGDNPSDVTHHTDTGDRVIGIRIAPPAPLESLGGTLNHHELVTVEGWCRRGAGGGLGDRGGRPLGPARAVPSVPCRGGRCWAARQLAPEAN